MNRYEGSSRGQRGTAYTQPPPKDWGSDSRDEDYQKPLFYHHENRSYPDRQNRGGRSNRGGGRNRQFDPPDYNNRNQSNTTDSHAFNSHADDNSFSSELSWSSQNSPNRKIRNSQSDHFSTTQPNNSFEEHSSGFNGLQIGSGGFSSSGHSATREAGRMVLSKMRGPNSQRPSTEDIVEFLREYKTLECSCCNGLMGFQHRVTGVLFCTMGCSGGQHQHEEASNVEKPVVPSLSHEFNNGHPNKLKYIEETPPDRKYHQQSRPNPPSATAPTFTKSEPPSSAAPARSFTKTEPPSSLAAPRQPFRHETNSYEQKQISSTQNYDDGIGNSESKKESSTSAGLQSESVTNAAVVRKNHNPFQKRLPSSKISGEDLKPHFSNNTFSSLPIKSNPTSESAHLPIKPKPVELPSSKPHLYSRRDCSFSKNLVNGALVKISFVYHLNKVQVTAQADDDDLTNLQETVNDIFQKNQEVLITRKPILNEIVLGEYSGEYYRARVIDIDGDHCKLFFIDFGDYNTVDLKTEKLYALNDEIKSAPVMSVCIRLDGVEFKKKVKGTKDIENLFERDLKLQLVDELIIKDQESYLGILWLADGHSINEKVIEFLSAVEAT